MSQQPHRARKRFGQNFLVDQHVLTRIAEFIAPTPEQHLVEIGPGQGALTDYIVKEAGQLDLIELDRDLIGGLEQKYGHLSHCTIHQADALKFNYPSICNQPKSLRVIGNLPYNISTPLLFHLLDHAELIQDMTFLLQKEVVQRITAPVNSSHYGRLAIMTQYHCQTLAIFDVPPEAFQPQPKVHSAFVFLKPHTEKPYPANSLNTLGHVVTTAFSQRRKTISNSLKKIFSTEQLHALNINPKSRPQELTLAEYVTIANALSIAT